MAKPNENPATQPAIAPDEVRRTAELARLYLSPAELVRTTAELARILEYAGALQSVDVSGVEPTVHAVPLDSPLRDDAVGAQSDLEGALAAAPASQDRYFVVPAIFETHDTDAADDAGEGG
jgi:aspartyl-tRNA(Asn)/glutamyl-tRNA(Gln) amidotransferase subunit C